MRALVVLVLLVAAGCTAPPAPMDDAPSLRLLALDGRWEFPARAAAALLAEAGVPAPVGELVLGEATGAGRVLAFAGLDAAAARALGVDAPRAGEALWLAPDAEVELRAYAFPPPYVATYFEMERTIACERRPDAKLCFLPSQREGEARLRLRVDEGARDAAFLPDLVELGSAGRPAFWNGTFRAPDGTESPFTAHALVEGDIRPAERVGPMASGEWTITFRLEADGVLQPSGAAGIVRVREPGFLWFDDRLQLVLDARDQARAVLANATPTRAHVRAAAASALPLGVDVLLSIEDARALAGAAEVTALLVNVTDAQARALEAARGPDGMTLALRARALPARAAAPGAGAGALVLAAPPDLDVAALPPVEGLGAPSLALAGRAPVAERVTMDGALLSQDTLLLAPASGPAPWGLPGGGRWTRAEDALENLSRSRTLALGSPDLVAEATATKRIEVGQGNTTRVIVAIGGVAGGPERALWTSAALVAGSGKPVAPRLIVPVEPGADRDAAAARALDAWGALGVARDR